MYDKKCIRENIKEVIMYNYLKKCLLENLLKVSVKAIRIKMYQRFPT